MPATRLLVVAEPKMLNALANGLRVGGRFEIATAPFAEPSELAPLCTAADVVALFYGSKTFSLAAAVQELAPGVRSRGARLVAVLQKDQAQLRDDCFRAGASDLLFMPMPKDLFVARLFESASLAFSDEEGLSAQVSLVCKDVSHLLDAKVTSSGIAAKSGPALPAGETVQLRWSAGTSFSRWGLVVQSGEGGVRVRIAGANADEEAQLRAWVKGLPPPAQAAAATPISESLAAPASQSAPTSPAPAPAGSGALVLADAKLVASTLLDVQSVPPTLLDTKAVAPTLLDTKAVPATVLEVKAIAPTQLDVQAVPPTLLEVKAVPPTQLDVPAAAPAWTQAQPAARAPAEARPAAETQASGARVSSSGAILAGPPPGFAARPPIRPQSVRGSQATMPGRPRLLEGSQTGEPGAVPSSSTPAAKIAPSSPGEMKASAVPSSASAGASAGGSAGGLSSLFDEPAAPRAAEGAGTEPPLELAPLPNWPTPLEAALAKSLLTIILRDKSLPKDAPPEPAAAVRKVADALSSTEREALANLGADSHLHEALVARAQLAHSTAEGVGLCNAGAGALVDDEHLTVLMQAADAAGKRLQAEANRAIAKGEVEALQQVTAASAALSRELLAFKETADRLRGLATAPRLGAGALDPSVGAVAPAAKPPSIRREKSEKEKEDQRAEQRKQLLADFSGLQQQDAAEKTQKQKRLLWIALGILAVSTANALFFAIPSAHPAAAALLDQAGPGVLEITLSDKTAIVGVAQTWMNAHDRKARLRSVCDVLQGKGVKRAAVFVDGKGIVGQIHVADCQPIGLAPPKPAPPELGGKPDARGP